MSPWHESLYCSTVHLYFKTSVPSSGRNGELQVCWVDWRLFCMWKGDGGGYQASYCPWCLASDMCCNLPALDIYRYTFSFLMNFLCNSGIPVVFFWGWGRRESLESRKKSKGFRWLAETKQKQRQVSSKRATLHLPWLVSQSKSTYTATPLSPLHHVQQVM